MTGKRQHTATAAERLGYADATSADHWRDSGGFCTVDAPSWRAFAAAAIAEFRRLGLKRRLHFLAWVPVLVGLYVIGHLLARWSR